MKKRFKSKRYQVLLFRCTVLVLCVSLTSCDWLVKKYYGITDLEKFDKQACEVFLAGFDFSDFDGVEQMYWSGERLEKFAKEVTAGQDFLSAKDLKQPVQMIYLNAEHEVVSYHANCYVPAGASGLNWNYDHRFGVFPPQSAVEIDESFVLPAGVWGSDQNIEYPGTGYTVIILWTLAFEGPVTDAVNTVLKNKREKAAEMNLRAVFVNTDQFFALDSTPKGVD